MPGDALAGVIDALTEQLVSRHTAAEQVIEACRHAVSAARVREISVRCVLFPVTSPDG